MNKSTLPTPEPWQKALRDAVTNIDELCEILQLPETFRTQIKKPAHNFSLKVPRAFLAKIQPGDIDDPLLRQILPMNEENVTNAVGYSSDPVGDLNYTPEQGIVHKYHGRVLLITTGACAIHCRYCFRREFPYHEQIAARNDWQSAIEYIRADKSISEVILSGGDPLSLSDSKLGSLLLALNEISHLTTIRIHTRQPVVLPERVNTAFLDTLKLSSKKIVCVLHINHPQEICERLAQVSTQMSQDLGVILLNQSVLLRGVNDNVQTLMALSRRLFELNIMPYYINLLDKVTGTHHFEVSEDAAIQIHQELRRLLPGYLVPKLVRDEANGLYKSQVFSN